MKWLLISNNGNPGDIWVRLGIMRIIEKLDSDPKFIVRERDFRKVDPHDGLTEPKVSLDFDYSVICGMPFLWSHREKNGVFSSPIQHSCWVPLNGWILSGAPMIVAGFGITLFCSRNQLSYHQPKQAVVDELQKLFDKCVLVYSRNPLVKEFFSEVNWLHCPSVLAIDQNKEKDLKLANFMPGGGHYPDKAPKAAKRMEKLMPGLAKRLIDEGYHFAAHRNAERDLALDLGWPKNRIFTWRNMDEKLLDVYSRCSKYFGNRVHGAIVSRAVGADCILLGYDTRLQACRRMGITTLTPHDYNPIFKQAISLPPTNRPYDIDLQWKSHLSWWSSKLKLPILDNT